MDEQKRELTRLAHLAAATINIEPSAYDRAALEDHFREAFFEFLEAGRPRGAVVVTLPLHSVKVA